MADFLFDRRVRVIIASPLAEDYKSFSAQTLVIEDLRVQFKVEKGRDKAPNKGEITITNLAERTRSSLQAKGARVILQAGYDVNLATIFIGDVRTIDHIREGPDWNTRIEAGDGERAMLFARVGESFGPGIKVPEIIKAAAKKLGLDASGLDTNIKGLASMQYDNGYTMSGKASTELDKVIKAAGYEWSVQDGKIQVLPPDGANTERIITLSSDSGLIGSPAYGTSEKKGKPPYLKFKSLLSPEIRPGGRINFASVKYQGVHVVHKVKHEGDTAGGAWYSEGEAAAQTVTVK